MGPQGSGQIIKWVSNATDDTKEEAKRICLTEGAEGAGKLQLPLR